MFSALGAKTIIDTAMQLTDNQCEITVDTITGHYWNYIMDSYDYAPDWDAKNKLA